MAAPLVFDKQFDPQTGQPVQVAGGLVRITAPNSSAYTFTGTNSFLLGHERLAVLDPGPDDDRHLAALLQAIAGRPVDAVVLTHTHRDHSALAGRLARHLGAPLWFGGAHRLSRPLHRFERNRLRGSSDWGLVPDRVVVDGETIRVGDLQVTVHATPGHCANHLAFGCGDMLLSGDHVMGWNSTLIAVPDGSIADYFGSLDKITALPYRRYHPAHGGPIEDGPAFARSLRAHRELRNGQIVDAVQRGARTIGAIVAAIYPQQTWPVRRAARMTVAAHVEYLAAQNRLLVSRGLLGLRITLHEAGG
ncbi:MBL fold metallo-hydrolase [Devosia submarina]|uniref:MBL fold metallo-hydrolase n=1 Tax=Devosia submarina TaxID=1173082 RepID=UPI000D346BBB|nr:MBL fold metallo-hydrolase [Devosia submarina]